MMQLLKYTFVSLELMTTLTGNVFEKLIYLFLKLLLFHPCFAHIHFPPPTLSQFIPISPLTQVYAQNKQTN